VRRFTSQTYKGLQTAWLNISQQPSTGSADTVGRGYRHDDVREWHSDTLLSPVPSG
jgi:hypothetical protein